MRGLNALDFVVIVAYLVGVTLLGMWVGRRQRDAKDYFVADREIPWWAVMFSIVASETSALTFISIPGLAYTTNLGFLQIAVGYLLGRIVVAYTLLPRYYEGNLVTAYALLEQRFGLATRRFTSIVFMVTRGMADSVRVFATAVPIALIIGPLLPAKARDAGRRAGARHAHDPLHDSRRHARRRVDGDRAGVGLPPRRRRRRSCWSAVSCRADGPAILPSAAAAGSSRSSAGTPASTSRTPCAPG